MDTIDPGTKFSALNITTPKKTLTLDTNITLPNAWVEKVIILFAPGHVLLTGVAIRYNGNTILPFDGVGQFIFGDNERLTFPIDMYMPARITVRTVNTDTLAHGHVVTFQWHTYKDAGVTPLAPIPTIVT